LVTPPPLVVVDHSTDRGGAAEAADAAAGAAGAAGAEEWCRPVTKASLDDFFGFVALPVDVARPLTLEINLFSALNRRSFNSNLANSLERTEGRTRLTVEGTEEGRHTCMSSITE
jgi:hypothetical protein